MAGYLEGRISSIDIFNFLKNIEENYRIKENSITSIKEIKDFLKQSNEGMINKAKLLKTFPKAEQDYYYKIYIFFAQIQGMLKGFNKSVEISLKNKKEEGDLSIPLRYIKIEDLLLVQVDGEIPELMRFIEYRRNVDSYDLRNRKFFERIFRIDSQDPKTIWKRMMWRSRCSAYIKLIKNESNEISELYTGHNAWTDFTETLRTYKQ
jgi:hypothetical protein